MSVIEAPPDWRSWAPEDKERLASRLREKLRPSWRESARSEQLAPEGDWNVWLFMAGRGAGKSRAAAEDMAAYGLANPRARLAVVAPTYADARDTCVEGESGLLACLPESEVETWNRSLGELVLRNGTRYKLFSGDEPKRLRGPQHERAWADELAHFTYPEAWDMLMMGLRLGEHPQAIATTTPRPTTLMRELLQRDDVVVTRGSTFDNAANLAPSALESLRRRYGGTRLGRQELQGELIEEAEGALWLYEWIEALRIEPGSEPAEGLWRVKVMGLDPSDGKADGAEEAWTEMGLALDHRIYVTGSEGMRVRPGVWLRKAVTRALEIGAVMVIEGNHGGAYLVDLLERVMKDMGVRVPYQIVRASKGKTTRAEPLALLYEQSVAPGAEPKIHHVGAFPELEDQMISFTGAGGEVSPDRLDSCVWGAHFLLGYERGPQPADADKAVPYAEPNGRPPVGAAVAYR